MLNMLLISTVVGNMHTNVSCNKPSKVSYTCKASLNYTSFKIVNKDVFEGWNSQGIPNATTVDGLCRPKRSTASGAAVRRE